MVILSSLTRALGGGAERPPSFFDSKIYGGAQRRRVFTHLIISFPKAVKYNMSPMRCDDFYVTQVTSDPTITCANYEIF